ncbi:hypothetical protein [Cognatishimia sp. MH4019]|uniref:hypothetical protein n=1 Tax=Cognatishimia sp. MH4019 TaxID=2854030 RepID=UPI001CD60A7A|nr:hypothetical protein [Cognatishimia sp. MH4019]
MNANQIINMVLRMVMRRVIGMGVNKGIDMATKRGAKDPKDMTPEERMQAQQGKEAAKKARQTAKLRRMGRF